MTADTTLSDAEEQWLWNTRITAEAARAALAKGKTAEERFLIYEQMIAAAYEARRQAKGGDGDKAGAGDNSCRPGQMFYDDEDPRNSNLSGFDATDDDPADAAR